MDHRINGRPIIEIEMKDEVQCMTNLQLDFVKLVGPYLSWSKRGECVIGFIHV